MRIVRNGLGERAGDAESRYEAASARSCFVMAFEDGGLEDVLIRDCSREGRFGGGPCGGFRGRPRGRLPFL